MRVSQWWEHSLPSNVHLVLNKELTWVEYAMYMSHAWKGFSLGTPVLPSTQNPGFQKMVKKVLHLNRLLFSLAPEMLLSFVANKGRIKKKTYPLTKSKNWQANYSRYICLKNHWHNSFNFIRNIILRYISVGVTHIMPVIGKWRKKISCDILMNYFSVLVNLYCKILLSITNTDARPQFIF